MDRFPTKILLATDGSEDTSQATRAASDLASRGGSELHVVHVWHDVPAPYRKAYVKTQLRLQGQEVLDEQVGKIEEGGGSVAQAHLRGGRTVDEVVALSEELGVGLLVVGTRGLRGMRRILMGSHSEDIVHHTRVPVLVVRCGEDVWPPDRVVAGDDLSEDARQAGELAAGVAKLIGAPMMLLHAGPQPPPGSTEPRVEEKLEERADALADILGERPQTRVVEGNPAEVLVGSAGEGKTLVAVGSRGTTVVERLRLGSVTTKVIRAALDAVLVHPQLNGGR